MTNSNYSSAQCSYMKAEEHHPGWRKDPPTQSSRRKFWMKLKRFHEYVTASLESSHEGREDRPGHSAPAHGLVPWRGCALNGRPHPPLPFPLPCKFLFSTTHGPSRSPPSFEARPLFRPVADTSVRNGPLPRAQTALLPSFRATPPPERPSHPSIRCEDRTSGGQRAVALRTCDPSVPSESSDGTAGRSSSLTGRRGGVRDARGGEGARPRGR
eukprot:scaffold68_cov340-Pavlova_lutheri.AAC.40